MLTPRGFTWGTTSRAFSGRSVPALARPITFGELQAWDLNTGKRAWQQQFQGPCFGHRFLVTGGDILFAGGLRIGCSGRFDARTGKQLWSFPFAVRRHRCSIVILRSTGNSMLL